MLAPMTRWIAAVAAAALTAPAFAAAATPDHVGCFRTQDWDGWSAPGRGDVVYLRVARHDVYRVELTPGARVHDDGYSVLLNQTRGSSWICRPMDLDLVVTDRMGTRVPLTAHALRKLSPAEVAAMPRKDLP